MKITQIKKNLLWRIFLGLGRSGFLSSKTYRMISSIKENLKCNKRIIPSDIVDTKIWRNKEENRLLAQVCELGNRSIYHEGITDEMVNEIRKIMESDKIRNDILNVLESYAIICGLYQLAFELRKKSEDNLIKKYEVTKIVKTKNVIPLFWAYISSKEIEKAKNMLHRSSKAFKLLFGKELSYLITLLEGRNGNNIVEKNTINDQMFANLLNDKTVLILGPMGDNGYTKHYMDKCDVVISMTYRKNLVEEIGEKKHISYYNGQSVQLLGEKKLKYYMLDLDIAVFKEIQHLYQEEMVQERCARVAYGGSDGLCNRKDKVFFSFLYATVCESNLLQRILLDILLFKPKKIYVANANLYWGKKRYNDKYVITEEIHGLIDDKASFATHNMINMYQITKFLYDSGVIEVDAELKKILDMGLKQYMCGMQQW